MSADRDYYKRWKTGEVIDLVGQLPFAHGSAIKYLLRPRKGQHLEDLEKARWYLRRIASTGTAQARIPGAGTDGELGDMTVAFALELRAAGYEHEAEALAFLAAAFFGPPTHSHECLMRAIFSIEAALDDERDRVKSF